MSVKTRVKKIEQSVNKHGKKRLFIVEEYKGRYFIEKDGQTIEVKEPPKSNDPNETVVILKSYSDPITGEYEV